ncbi:unnamed protein product [Clavelina lepadiformis]|uniref:Uncharacterized protein n=1 Tax=Clavelina lepadiformis TaxID=159417 RepID=A0ABP0FU81_CLALP
MANRMHIVHLCANVTESGMTKDPKGFLDMFIVTGQIDLANIQFMRNLSRQHNGSTTYNFNPGWVYTEGYGTNLFYEARILFYVPMILFGQELHFGYQPLLKLVLNDSVVKHSSGFFTGFDHEELLPHATNESAWEPLMIKSLEVTGLSST